MDIRYKVYLDGLQIFTMPDGLDELVLSIIRENGFDNSEQILRDDAESQLSFTGDGFEYICSKRKLNICEEIKCIIQVVCNAGTYTIFEGIIKQSKIQIHHKGSIAECTNLKDNSFSGVLRDFINVDVELFNTKTKNCEPLLLPVTMINTPTVPSGYTLDNVITFDALDILKYIISFFTDNRVTVKSDYLTNTKITFTTVYNLHNSSGNLNKVYPKISFEKVFNELRKAETLYKTIKYEADGTPYISIEAENDSYSDDPADLLFTIDEIPIDAVETIDEKRLFNSINVGSSEVKLADDAKIIVPQDRLTGWNKENYIGCGGCSGEKDTTLDLVNEVIIDGNIVHEAMLQDEGADYTHDDKIVMINYYDAGSSFKLVGNNTSVYNERFNNENKLNRWVGISNSCIISSRFAKYGFLTRRIGFQGFTNGGAGFVCGEDKINFINPIYDNQNSLSLETIAAYASPCSAVTVPEFFTDFNCVEVGNYKFGAKVVNIKQSNGPGEIVSLKYTIKVNVYQDNTHAVLLSTYTQELDVEGGYKVSNINLETPFISLAIGNVVQVDFLTEITSGFFAFNFIFNSDYAEFMLLEDDTSCENITDNTGLFKPFNTDFDYEVTIEQYLNAKLRKNGYVLLKGQKVWLNKLTFRDRKISSLSFIHKQSFCSC